MLSSIVQCKFCASSHRLIFQFGVRALAYLPFCFMSVFADRLRARSETPKDARKMKSKACCSSKGSGLSDNLCANIAHNWQFILMIGILMHAIDVCNGHGRLIEPPSRSSAFRYGFQTPPNYNGEFLLCFSFLLLFFVFSFCFQ